ncbi:MAG: hypothetical protein PHE50_00780 [Dehalococcoidales bacterium]|nr:hypothetical protein [Dehalococcoidales bacterium]
MENFQDEVIYSILDCFINMPWIFGLSTILVHVTKTTNQTETEVKRHWEYLEQTEMIVQDNNRIEYLIHPQRLEEIKNSIRQWLITNRVTLEESEIYINEQLVNNPENQSRFIALLGKSNNEQDYQKIEFVDGERFSELGDACNNLYKKGLLFLSERDTKKHYYTAYDFRRWPFNSYKLFSDIIKHHVKIEALSNNSWQILAPLLYIDDSWITINTIQNTTGLTRSEMRESISSLASRGLVEENNDTLILSKGIRQPIVRYFQEYVYPEIKNDSLMRVKTKVTSSISNLYPIMYIKKLNELPSGTHFRQGLKYKVVPNNEVLNKNDISDACQLGIALDLGEYLIIHEDILDEIENWIKGSLNIALTIIPSDTPFLAHSIVKSIFSQCEEYVKIQDPYVGEDTLRMITSYVSKDIEVKLLTSQDTSQGENAEDIINYIERLKNERKSNFQICFIGRKGKEAPFHDRYIITKNKCWVIGTSLKQLGKGKDSTIFEVSLEEKNEKIEPAFDWNWSAKQENLNKNNLTRLDFNTWKSTIKSIT